MHVLVGWAAALLGAASGALIGLFFHEDTWAGGYSSFRRRMLRLGHISFFGIGFLNVAYYAAFSQGGGSPIAGTLLIVGAVFMPTLCYLSAFKPAFRHLFFIPAGSILLATIFTLERMVTS